MGWWFAGALAVGAVEGRGESFGGVSIGVRSGGPGRNGQESHVVVGGGRWVEGFESAQRQEDTVERTPVKVQRGSAEDPEGTELVV